VAAPQIKFPSRPSQTPVQPARKIPTDEYIMAAETGRLRYLAGAVSSKLLPMGTPTKLADAAGASGIRYVRIRSNPVGAPQPTFFSQDISPSGSNGDQMTLVGGDIFEQLLLPGEKIYATNNGAVAYSVIVFEVQIKVEE